MPYSTPSMVRQALAPEPGGDTGTAADYGDSVLADAIAEADAVINGYLAGRYNTPVTAVSPATDIHPVDYWSRNIAAYNATLAFRGGQDFTDNDPVARRYNATMLQLNAVASGTLVLGFATNQSDTSGASAAPPNNPYTGTLFAASDFDLYPDLWPTARPRYPWGAW